MKKSILRQYAKLIVRCGVNVQKGQEVLINCGLDQPEFVAMVVEEAYKAKAGKVTVNWNYQPLTKLHARYQSVKTLGSVETWETKVTESAVNATTPRVGIVMGSDSDWPVMQEAAKALGEFGISHEADVVSAHRMPEEMVAYGREAHARGLEVIIAGAGGAAHLPGMLASLTPLPVISVPVPLRHLDGMDSLLSIVQMPAGVPVATVSIGNARNAGHQIGRAHV